MTRYGSHASRCLLLLVLASLVGCQKGCEQELLKTF